MSEKNNQGILSFKADKKSEKKEETKSVKKEDKKCAEPLEISEKQMDIEIDYLSRKFDKKNYDNALIIYNELVKNGEHPRIAVHAWELLDQAFAFPSVRRYDMVQQQMDFVQHMQDNLNMNFTN